MMARDMPTKSDMAINWRWQQSAKVAAISPVLAKCCPGFDPDHALLADLFKILGAALIK